MATKKHKPKKAHKGKTPKKGSRRGKKGLSGTTAAKAKNMKAAFTETGKTTGGLLLGFLASAAAGYGIDKISFLTAKDTDGKVMAIVKKAIKPVTLIVVGGTVAVVGRHKGMKFISSIGDGFTIGGGYSAVKAIVGTKTAMFNGLGSSDSEVLSKVANYYTENMEALKDVMAENNQLLKLNGLSATEENADLGRNAFNSEIRTEEAKFIL